ncbi:GNAT family N-acetyltransferase [Agromyces silvae]|uniref:GNAT family N-acetyltransferase n=1 Tax=Agromyces silvae TaxID=3388266 RepID=UPI00280AA625|nr:GNAT family N-acetyltransferase [Agromyces protaetiae]
MPFDLRSLPVDRRSASLLGKRGLTYRAVDPADRVELDAWLHADQRGFHEPRPTAAELDFERTVFGDRRLLGVYDATATEPEIPVATISGWPTGLSVPGDRSVDAWAVSSVTVAPTHRRRGIARALLEAELRAATEAGAALAVLTVTEATIYGRYGFAPAARSATVSVDRRRAHWSGPDAPGRVHLVEPASLRDLAPQLARRAVARTPGEIDRWPGLLDRVLGLVEPDAERSRRVRAIRYDDERGEPQGFLTYRVTREPDRPGVLQTNFMAAATDDAERALWRTLVEVDFIDEVRALLRSVDEPLPWLLEDRRAVTVSDVVDHLWVRVLDPVAALRARRYGAPGSLTLEIEDPLGHADGTFELEVASDGRAEVSRVEAPADAPAAAARRRRKAGTLRLGVRELGAIYLGDVRPTTLLRAGTVTETGRGVAALADRIFAASRAPQLSIWF